MNQHGITLINENRCLVRGGETYRRGQVMHIRIDKWQSAFGSTLLGAFRVQGQDAFQVSRGDGLMAADWACVWVWLTVWETWCRSARGQQSGGTELGGESLDRPPYWEGGAPRTPILIAMYSVMCVCQPDRYGNHASSGGGLRWVRAAVDMGIRQLLLLAPARVSQSSGGSLVLVSSDDMA